jgi:hypothetical protein
VEVVFSISIWVRLFWDIVTKKPAELVPAEAVFQPEHGYIRSLAKFLDLFLSLSDVSQ